MGREYPMKFEDQYKILELMAKPNPQAGAGKAILNSICVSEPMLNKFLKLFSIL